MKKLKNFVAQIWNDEDGQGMAEYVLLIVVVLGIAMVFKKQIKEMVDKKLGEVGSTMDQFKSE